MKFVFLQDTAILSMQDEINLMKGYLACGWLLPAAVITPYVIYKQVKKSKCDDIGAASRRQKKNRLMVALESNKEPNLKVVIWC